MAKITLNINANDGDARRKIAALKTDLKSLEQFKIKVAVDASGVQALDKSVLKSVDSFAKLTNAQARLKESENALAIQSEKTRQEEIKLESQRERTRRSMQSQREETDKLNQSSKSLLDSFAQYAKASLISGVISGVVGALRDAVSTMKAVDDELVTVRKVTGITGDELKSLERQAYATATAYGQTVPMSGGSCQCAKVHPTICASIPSTWSAMGTPDNLSPMSTAIWRSADNAGIVEMKKAALA